MVLDRRAIRRGHIPGTSPAQLDFSFSNQHCYPRRGRPFPTTPVRPPPLCPFVDGLPPHFSFRVVQFPPSVCAHDAPPWRRCFPMCSPPPLECAPPSRIEWFPGSSVPSCHHSFLLEYNPRITFFYHRHHFPMTLALFGARVADFPGRLRVVGRGRSVNSISIPPAPAAVKVAPFDLM